MIGKATAALQSAPRRWVQRLWGYPYLHARQDWTVVWPQLKQLPARLSILDAGCGAGRWTLELAARRPGWFVVGVDQNADALREAEANRRRLGLTNVAFVNGRFSELSTGRRFDVVLSVCSAHYVAEQGRGPELFQWLRGLLADGGLLVLYAPRRGSEAPFVRWLPRFTWRTVFSETELRANCSDAGLEIATLDGYLGWFGTAAKQLDAMATGPHRRLLMVAGLYPLECLCHSADRLVPPRAGRSTLMWLLVARAQPRSATVSGDPAGRVPDRAGSA